MLSGCQTNTDVKNTATKAIPDKSVAQEKVQSSIKAAEERDEAKWNFYYNSRFGFSIKYPLGWTAGEESDNGDGKALYVGNPDVDIIMYAHYYNEDLSPYNYPDSLRLQRLKLDSGIEADMLIGYENERYVMDVFAISSEDIEYHYKVNVSKEFFNKNEDVLLKVAKSINFPK